MNKLNLKNLGLVIMINSVILAVFSVVIFMILISGSEETSFSEDFLLIFIIGGIICFFLSLFASLVVYLPILVYEKTKHFEHKQLFEKYLPLFVILFPIGGVLLVQEDIRDIISLAMIISAYLTSVLGWYMITKNVTKN